MTCEELLAALNDYVDGERLTAVCEKFAEHLAGCNPCQVVVDNIRQTISLYRDGEPYPLPDVFQFGEVRGLTPIGSPPVPNFSSQRCRKLSLSCCWNSAGRGYGSPSR